MPANLPKSLIDMHCHVFNGTDLPAIPFIKNLIKETSSTDPEGLMLLVGLILETAAVGFRYRKRWRQPGAVAVRSKPCAAARRGEGFVRLAAYVRLVAVRSRCEARQPLHQHRKKLRADDAGAGRLQCLA